MLIVAVSNTKAGNMVQVRPVQQREEGFRCRSPTTQSAPVQKVENEIKHRGRKSASDPQGISSGIKPTGVTFAESLASSSNLTGSQYTTASDTERDNSLMTVVADIETNDDFLDGNDSDDSISDLEMDNDDIEINEND